MRDVMICTECNGSGACDPCDGYGTFPESSPNAGDGPECDTCDGSGSCSGCRGTGENTHTVNTDQGMSA